jgi:hypothetical protein
MFLVVVGSRNGNDRRAGLGEKMERPIRANDSHFLLVIIQLTFPPIRVGNRFPRGGREEEIDRPSGIIHFVNGVGKRQKIALDGKPAKSPVTKVSLKGLARLFTGRCEAGRPKAAEEVIVDLMIAEQPVLIWIVEPAFRAGLRIIRA